MPGRLLAHARRNAVAYLALSIALGGTSYAAARLPANSVGAKQIRRNAVTGAKVKNGSLLGADFKAGALPAGRIGPQGPAGIKGDPGAKGDAGTPGAIGPSDAFTTFAAGATAIDATLTNMKSLSLPAGKYVLLGRLSLQGAQQIVR